MSTDDRFINLESKIAFQEKTIDLLKEVLEEHDKKLVSFGNQLDFLARQLSALGDSSQAPEGEEPPPPHYHPQ